MNNQKALLGYVDVVSTDINYIEYAIEGHLPDIISIRAGNIQGHNKQKA
ncbi:hypothetical protein L3C95_09445 [Chitinophaga filiformis]|nr:hypothetical protein [Chitinophaga filiformis]MCF6403097.1 hypothetical protein [Chitinophaga filiformis]